MIRRETLAVLQIGLFLLIFTILFTLMLYFVYSQYQSYEDSIIWNND